MKRNILEKPEENRFSKFSQKIKENFEVFNEKKKLDPRSESFSTTVSN